MEGRPIWMPDTSTINVLADDLDSEALIAGLKSGYFVRNILIQRHKAIPSSGRICLPNLPYKACNSARR